MELRRRMTGFRRRFYMRRRADGRWKPLNVLRRFKYKSKTKIAINKSGEVMKRGSSFINPNKFRQNKMEKPAASVDSFNFFICWLLCKVFHCHFMFMLKRIWQQRRDERKYDEYVNTLTSTCIRHRSMILYRCEVDHKQTYPFV